MATNEPLSLAVGWPWRWKICGSPRKKKNLNLRQITVCGGGGEERPPCSPSERGAGSCPGPGAGLCPAVPTAVSSREGLSRGTGLAQETVSHPAACPLLYQQSAALPWCSVYSLLLLSFASSENRFIAQISATERKRQPYVHAKRRTQSFHGRGMHRKAMCPAGAREVAQPWAALRAPGPSLQPGSCKAPGTGGREGSALILLGWHISRIKSTICFLQCFREPAFAFCHNTKPASAERPGRQWQGLLETEHLPGT